MFAKYVRTITIIMLPIVSSAVSAENAAEFGDSQMKEVLARCKEYGQIVAEARLNKWKKEGKDAREAFAGAEPYTIVSKMQQQQCVSVSVIQMMQAIKAITPTKKSEEMKIDELINNHMALIEKTL